MLLAASYLLNIKKSQIEYCANSGFISKICQLCKSFLPSIRSVLCCIFAELHLQHCQKTKCIFMAFSKSLIKWCLMKPKGNFSIIFHFPWLPVGYLWRRQRRWHTSWWHRGISIIHILPNKKFKCQSSPRGKLEGGICFITESTSANSKSPPFHRRVYKIPLPFVKRKLSQHWCTEWHLLTLKASSVISQQPLFLLQRVLLCCLA